MDSWEIEIEVGTQLDIDSGGETVVENWGFKTVLDCLRLTSCEYVKVHKK